MCYNVLRRLQCLYLSPIGDIHMFKALTIAIMVAMTVMVGGEGLAIVQFANAHGEGYDNPCGHAPRTYAYQHGCHGGGY
jgi:hypothetical protein